MSEDDDKKLPAIQNRIIGAAVDIWQDDPLGIVYQHSLFCQVALPRSRPEGRVFERAYRNGSIRMHQANCGMERNGSNSRSPPVRSRASRFATSTAKP